MSNLAVISGFDSSNPGNFAKGECPFNTVDDDEKCAVDPIGYECLPSRVVRLPSKWCHNPVRLANYALHNTHRQLTDPVTQAPIEHLRTEIVNTPSFSIYVKTLSGETFTVAAHPNTTIEEIKEALVDKVELNVDQQRLLLNHRRLGDFETLSSIGITSDTTLYLVMRL